MSPLRDARSEAPGSLQGLLEHQVPHRSWGGPGLIYIGLLQALSGVPRSHEILPPLGLYRRPMPGAIWWSWGEVPFLMSEVPMYSVLDLLR